MMGYEVRRDGSMVPSGVPGETGLSEYEEKALFMFRNFLTPALVNKAQRLNKSLSEDESERYNPTTGVEYDFAREAKRTIGIREYEASVDVMFTRRVRDFTGRLSTSREICQVPLSKPEAEKTPILISIVIKKSLQKRHYYLSLLLTQP